MTGPRALLEERPLEKSPGLPRERAEETSGQPRAGCPARNLGENAGPTCLPTDAATGPWGV